MFLQLKLVACALHFLKFNNTKLILVTFFVETDFSGGIPANAFMDTTWWEVNVRRSTLVQSLIAVAVILWSVTCLEGVSVPETTKFLLGCFWCVAPF